MRASARATAFQHPPIGGRQLGLRPWRVPEQNQRRTAATIAARALGSIHFVASPLQTFRQWWQQRTGEDDTPLDGDTPAWFISMVVHMCLLIALAMLSGTRARRTQVIEFTSVNEPLDEMAMEQPQEFQFSDQPAEKIGAPGIGGGGEGVGAALGMAPNVSDVSVVPSPAVESLQADGVGDIRLASDVLVASGPQFSANLVVRGSAGVGVTGEDGAIDRITHEILLSLEERKTLVVWFFDASGSLARQRAEIVKRFDRIYEELGVIEAAGKEAFKKHDSKPLLTSIVSFGQNIKLLTPKPTDQIDEIKSAMSAIVTDESGIERTFTAVYQAAEKFRSYRVQEPRRNVMFVVFTDEVGDDDEQMLDKSVHACRKYEIPVYVVGVPAPFGRREVEIKYMPPEQFEQTAMPVPVRQGPETFQPEVVRLGFSNQGESDEVLDSGFGPYSLTRLCYETGGIFFAVHPNRSAGKRVGWRETALLSTPMTFTDPEIMRAYRPDYTSIEEYKRLLSENKARRALVEAASFSQVQPMERPQTHFPKVSEAELANRLSLAQRAAAVVEPRINRLYEVLKTGEKDRGKLAQPRWQAGYDLAMGRVLAVKVRTESYNAMLAKAKGGMKFKDAKNDTWDLKPADEISVGSALEKMAEQAKAYLQRVVQDHPGTPWAMLADRELQDPLGWTWEERFTGVNVPRERPGNNNAPPPRADDKRVMLAKPKPKAPLPKL